MMRWELKIPDTAEEPELLHLVDDGLGPRVGRLELVGAGLHVALKEAVDGLEDQVLVRLGQGLAARHGVLGSWMG
jgi:hypothetical protein